MSLVVRLHLRFKLEIFVFQMGKLFSWQEVYTIITLGTRRNSVFVVIIVEDSSVNNGPPNWNTFNKMKSRRRKYFGEKVWEVVQE
jgi:hypothetical protein